MFFFLCTIFNYTLYTPLSLDLWIFPYRCCAYVTKLEAQLFSHPTVSPPSHQEHSTSGGKAKIISDISDFLHDKENQPKLDGALDADSALQAVQLLSAQVDKLFEEAGRRLALPAMVILVRQLCLASRQQLQALQPSPAEKSDASVARPSSPTDRQLANLHLKRFAPLLVASCVERHHPLVSMLRLWGEASPHLVEVWQDSLSHIFMLCIFSAMFHAALQFVLTTSSFLTIAGTVCKAN